MTEASHDLLVFLSHMENFPHSFSDPEYGYQVEQIKAFAAEIRELTGLEKPPTPLLMSGPAPEGWEPPEYRHMGACNGCCGPLWEVIDDTIQPQRTGLDLVNAISARSRAIAEAIGWTPEQMDAAWDELGEIIEAGKD